MPEIFFQVKQHEFREDFRKTAPFMFNSQQVYEKLDKVMYTFAKIIVLQPAHRSL